MTQKKKNDFFKTAIVLILLRHWLTICCRTLEKWARLPLGSGGICEPITIKTTKLKYFLESETTVWIKYVKQNSTRTNWKLCWFATYTPFAVVACVPRMLITLKGTETLILFEIRIVHHCRFNYKTVV